MQQQEKPPDQGFFFQFCNIEYLEKFPKIASLVKLTLEKQKVPRFSQVLGWKSNKICQKRITAPDNLTSVCVLSVCANSRAHEEARGIHTQVTQSGWESNVHVGSSLVDKYAKFGSMEEAWRVFHKLTQSGSAECMCECSSNGRRQACS